MKFHCQRTTLLEALNIAARAVSLKTSIPALSGILLKADQEKNLLSITAYNLEIGICCTPEAEVSESGTVIFNAQTLIDIVQKLPEDTVFVEVNQDLQTKLRCGISRFSLLAMPGDEFPELPVINSENTLVLPAETLRSMIAQTAFSVAVTDAKPILTGVLFDVSGTTLRVVASDSSRLALREEELARNPEDEPFRFIVPATSLREIEKLLKRDDLSEVVLQLSRRHMLIRIDTTTFIARLLEGQFIKYEHFLNFAYKSELIVKTEEFSTSVGRMDLKNDDKIKNSIKCAFEDGVIRFNYISSRVTGYDECRFTGPCEPIEIGLSNKFVSDVVRVIEEEEVLLCLNTPSSPFVIRPTSGRKFCYIIAPVRIS